MHQQPDTEMPTLELDRRALCHELGLNPDTTSSITFDVDARLVHVTWTGHRTLTADELAHIIDVATPLRTAD